MKTLKKLIEATLILCLSLLLLSVWGAIPAHTGENIHRVLEAPKNSAEYKLGPKDPPVDVKLEGWYCGSIDYGTKLPEESERLEKHMHTLEYILTHEFFPWELVDPRTYYYSSDEAYEISLKKAVKRYNDSIKGLKIWAFPHLFKLWKRSSVIGPYDAPAGETKTYKYPSFLYRLCWSRDSLSILRENLAIQTISYNELLKGFPFVIAVYMQDSLEKLNPNLSKDLKASRLKPVFSDITPSDIKLISKAEGTKITIKVGREEGEKIEKGKKVVTGPGKTIPKDITVEGKKIELPAGHKLKFSVGREKKKEGVTPLVDKVPPGPPGQEDITIGGGKGETGTGIAEPSPAQIIKKVQAILNQSCPACQEWAAKVRLALKAYQKVVSEIESRFGSVEKFGEEYKRTRAKWHSVNTNDYSDKEGIRYEIGDLKITIRVAKSGIDVYKDAITKQEKKFSEYRKIGRTPSKAELYNYNTDKQLLAGEEKEWREAKTELAEKRKEFEKIKHNHDAMSLEERDALEKKNAELAKINVSYISKFLAVIGDNILLSLCIKDKCLQKEKSPGGKKGPEGIVPEDNDVVGKGPEDITIEGKKSPKKPPVPEKEVSEGKISSKTDSACEFRKPQIIGVGVPGLEGLPPNFPLPPGIKKPWKYEVTRGSLYAIGISAGWKDTVNFERKALRKHGWRIIKETTDQDPNVNTSWVHLFVNNKDYCGWVSIGTTVPEAPTPTSMNIGFEKRRD